MQNKTEQNLILFGFKSSGKTFFGKLLARKLRKKFIDTDRLIEARYKREYNEQATCRQISLKLGDVRFRELERKVIAEIAPLSAAIVALGGGTLLSLENYHLLKKNGKFVHLDVEKATIKKRILKNGVPSFLDPDNFDESFDTIYEKRRHLFETIESVKIKTSGKTEIQILNELVEYQKQI